MIHQGWEPPPALPSGPSLPVGNLTGHRPRPRGDWEAQEGEWAAGTGDQGCGLPLPCQEGDVTPQLTSGSCWDLQISIKGCWKVAGQGCILQYHLLPPGAEDRGESRPRSRAGCPVVWEKVLRPFGGPEVSNPSLQMPCHGRHPTALQPTPMPRRQEQLECGVPGPAHGLRAGGWAQQQPPGTPAFPRHPGQQRRAGAPAGAPGSLPRLLVLRTCKTPRFRKTLCEAVTLQIS